MAPASQAALSGTAATRGWLGFRVQFGDRYGSIKELQDCNSPIFLAILLKSDLVGDGLADGLGGTLEVSAVVVAVVPGRVVDGLGAGEHELRRPVGLRGKGVRLLYSVLQAGRVSMGKSNVSELDSWHRVSQQEGGL